MKANGLAKRPRLRQTYLSYWLCAATDCQLPQPISNALYKLVDNHTKPGAIAQYTCFNGYVPQSKSKPYARHIPTR